MNGKELNEIIFEWDESKAGSNLKKHSVSFHEAATVCEDSDSMTFDDPDHSGGEDRFLTIGYSSLNRLIIVSHADNQNTTRIISARRATKSERRLYEN